MQYIRGSRGSLVGMAPPPSSQTSLAPSVHPVIREVTEDTPPDLLEGTMELLVALPSTKAVRMTIDRRTPMMDLLIQVGTANKLNPGDHIVQVRNERGIELPYKPSTPIGALDTTTIEIVPKSKVADYIIVKKPAKLANQPFEHTFRLQVHLPRNQLYVMRVSPRTLLEDILKEVCQEKNLDFVKYEIRHPARLEEKLSLSSTLADYDLQEVTVVSKSMKINSSVSSADIMAMQMNEEARAKGYLDSSFKHSRSSVGDSSVSSGSTGSARGLSPTCSDDSRSVSPLPQNGQKSQTNTSVISNNSSSGIASSMQKSTSMSHASPSRTTSLPEGITAPPRTKKRAAPLPPPLVKSQTESSLVTSASAMEKAATADRVSEETRPVAPSRSSASRKKEAPRLPPNTRTPSADAATTSSNSSRPPTNHSRHSSGSSGYHESSVLSEQNESTRAERSIPMLSKQTAARSTSNLTTVSSVSSTSLASSTGGSSKKRRAPPPPAVLPIKPPEGIEEEEGSEASSSISHHGLVSQKSRGESRQSSVEVEVDVHHSSSRQASSDNSEGTPISLKDIEMSSSSAASSLSSPAGSSSGSTSSSPLPHAESPSSKPLPDHSSQYSSAKTSSSVSSSSKSDRNNGFSGNPNSLNSIDDSGRSSSSPSSGQAPAPLPPPRRKTQDAILPSNNDSASPSLNQPAPKPRAKPRPDRISVDNLVANDPVIIKPREEKEAPQIQRVSSASLRNPLARYGVKVLPDNVVKERADRLARQASMEELLGLENSLNETPKKSAAPPPPPVAKSEANSARLIKRESSSSSSVDSRKTKNEGVVKAKPAPPPPNLSKSDIPGKGSVRSIQNLNKRLTVQPKKDDKLVEYDSDNLEENMDFFEPVLNQKPKSGSGEITFKNSPKGSSLSSEGRVSEDEANNKPIPKPKLKIVKPDKATVNVFSGLSGVTQDSSDDILDEDDDAEVSSTNASMQLNRWQNSVSLHEIDNLASNNATRVSTNNKAANKLAGKVGRSSSEDYVMDDHEENGNMSSESEASYTDSGIPASAEPITPSPMDFDTRISDQEDSFDHLELKHNDSTASKEDESLPEGLSFESNDEENLKLLLERKSTKNEKEMESNFASMIPKDFAENQYHSNEEDILTRSERLEMSRDSSADDEGHISTSEGESLEDELKSLDMNPQAKRVSKSESFSHNSEFDVAKMRRKKFGSASSKAQDSKRGNSTIDLRRSSHHSSSEEDIRVPFTPKEDDNLNLARSNRLGGHNTSNKTQDFRATSMHNLTSGNEQKIRKSEASRVSNKEDKNSIQKTTSLREIPNGDSSRKDSDDMMQLFRNQLEAQFEQWKSEFLNQHGLDSETNEMDASAPVKKGESSDSDMEQMEVRDSSPEPPPTLSQSESEGVGGPFIVEETLKESKVVAVETRSPPSTQEEEDEAVEVAESSESESDDEPPPFQPAQAPVEVKVEPTLEVNPSKDISKDKPDTESLQIEKSPEVVRRMKPETKPPPTYRYTGPPTINMGSWTERPRTVVAVKTDADYIMGFGQADPKSSSSETVRSSQLLKVQRTPSFRTNDSVDKSPASATSNQNSSPALLQVVANATANNKANTLPVTKPAKGISATVNARPIVQDNEESSQGTVRSVLSSWKARMQENGNEKRTDLGPPPEIDIYGSVGTPDDKPTPISTVSIKVETVKRPEPTVKDKKDTHSNIVDVRIVEGGKMGERTNSVSSLIIKSYESNGSAVEDKNALNKKVLKKEESFKEIKKPEPVVVVEKITEKEIPEVKAMRPTKPMLFQMSSLDSRSVMSTRSFNNPPSEDTVDKAAPIQERATPVPVRPSERPQEDFLEPSIQEKKKFFQGIKPVESPGKETPLPAVNMKNSIATIQRVFEKRQKQESSPRNSIVIEKTTPTAASIPIKPVEKTEPAPKPAVQSNLSTTTSVPRSFQGMSSAEMVQRVLGKPSGGGLNLEALRRSPSPISSTTSTLSRTSSSGRGTPSSVTADSPENTIKVSTSPAKKAAPPPPSNISNVGNKAIIIVNGGDENKSASHDTGIARTDSVRNNIFAQRIAASQSGAKESNSTKVVLRGNSSVGKLAHQFTAERSIVLDQKVNSAEQPKKSLSVSQTEVKVEITKSVPVKKPTTLSVNGAGVPPPPPPPGLMEKTSISRTKSASSLNTSQGSKVSTPTSPSSPDPRSEIFSLIKGSNGNFGLKKTGASFLLK